MRSLIGLAIAVTLFLAANLGFAQQRENAGQRVQRPDGERQRDQRTQDPARRGGQRGGARAQRGDGQGGGGGLFRLLDTDRDGQLSAKEIDNAAAVLARLDVNKDGTLDAQELAVRGDGRAGQGGRGGRGGRGGQGGRGRQQGAEAQGRGSGQGGQQQGGRSQPDRG